jgi:Na+-driven multidrug efflux pump
MQLFTFLSIATTNIVSRNSLRIPGLPNNEAQLRRATAERTLCNALTMAAIFGAVVCVMLLTFGEFFLVGMGTGAEVVGPALAYMRVRAFAAPAVMVVGVCQGACLGQQDVLAPLRVALGAAGINAGGKAVHPVCWS